MSTLRVQLLGGVRVSHDNWETEAKITRELKALLAYLLLNRHRLHAREALANIFWGEHSQEKARGSLNTALWKLKKILEPEGVAPGTYLKSFHSGEVAFNQDSRYWLDIEVFEEGVNHMLGCPFPDLQASQLTDLEKILELYHEDLLEGFYEDWALRARERLYTLYLKGLTYVFHCYGFHNIYEKAIMYGQQVLDLDPLREEVHREIIRLHMENGQRSLAVQQYRICKSTLAKELGISPTGDTEALYRQIFAERIEEPHSQLSNENIIMEWALQQLEEANQSIDLAKKQIQNVVQLITENSLQQNRRSAQARTILKK